MQEYVHVYIFTFFGDIPCFFSRARSSPGKGGTGKYRPPYQPPYQPSTRVLDRRTWSIRLVSRAIQV